MRVEEQVGERTPEWLEWKSIGLRGMYSHKQNGKSSIFNTGMYNAMYVVLHGCTRVDVLLGPGKQQHLETVN